MKALAAHLDQGSNAAVVIPRAGGVSSTHGHDGQAGMRLLDHPPARVMTGPDILPRSFDSPLPIDAVLDELARTLAGSNTAVLVAPPGAGKTTRVPLALLDAPWLKNKKIIVLEPRRIAARASAERMARTLGERVGETVGYRVRFGTKVSRATRIEVVTEGIFSRQIL